MLGLERVDHLDHVFAWAASQAYIKLHTRRAHAAKAAAIAKPPRIPSARSVGSMVRV
jgi:hypothetical protein